MRKIKILAILFVIILLAVSIAVLSTLRECYKIETGPVVVYNTAETNEIMKDYHRAEENTYLTFPEWYIVYSAKEYANLLKDNLPSSFPYFSSVGQYWCNYYRMYQVTKGRYDFSTGNHISLLVIGTSFSVEYIIKGFYENTVGRLTELLGFYRQSDEDVYAYEVAKEYADSLYQTPWYEFPFGSKFAGLWGNTDFLGRNLLRKWERKAILSLEYGIKTIYGALIMKASHSAYGVEIPETFALVENLSDAILKDEPGIRLIRAVDSNLSLVSITRYEAFTHIVPKLIQKGLKFTDIEGNSEILLTAIAPKDWILDINEGQFLFAMEILTEPELKRVAIRVPVISLHSILNKIESSGAKLEHIYDY